MNSERPPVGLVGLGLMGSAIAANLMKAGYTVIGYDSRSAERRAHRRAGGIPARSCRELASRARVVICSLPSSESLLETAVALGSVRRPPRLVIDTSTLPIAVKDRARRRLRARGSILLDCPVSGTAAQARSKDLVVYTSGPRAACREAAPIIGGFALAQHHVGRFGAGSKMKIVANLLVAIHNVAAAEAVVLAKQAGLDAATMLRAVGDGAGSSRVLVLRGPMMARGRYSTPTMKLEVWRKDLAIIADFARELACPTPLFSATLPIYAAALAARPGTDDTAAVCAVLEGLAGRPRPSRPRRRRARDR